VLQEQSMTPISRRDEFHAYAAQFGKAIGAKNSIPLFYLTWARKATPSRQQDLTSAYTSIARNLQAEVAPAGMAWERCRNKDPQIELFDADGSHPGSNGTYLTACAFYAAIYMRSPRGLPATVAYDGTTVVNLTAADAAKLQDHAWQAYVDVRKQIYAEGIADVPGSP